MADDRISPGTPPRPRRRRSSPRSACRPVDAALVADSLVQADLWGHQSHGLLRLPWYAARIRSGAMTAVTDPAVLADTGALVLLDGRDGIGQVLTDRARELAVERARTHGVGVVGVRNSNHFGTAMWFTRRAAARRLRGRAHDEREPGDGAVGRPREGARHQPLVDRGPGAGRPRGRGRHRQHRGRPRQDLPGEEPRRADPRQLGAHARTAHRPPTRPRACSASSCPWPGTRGTRSRS